MTFPDWITDPNAWNTVQLGPVFLPGIATVDSVPCGRSIDEKKRKGEDGADLADNGMEPAKFRIELWLTAEDWALWLQVLPKIHPQSTNVVRAPLEIVHPLPNSMGVRTVYVASVTAHSPSAGGGMKIQLDVRQWFPPKPKRPMGQPTAASAAYQGDPQQLARDLAKRHGFLNPSEANRFLEPNHPDNILANLYG